MKLLRRLLGLGPRDQWATVEAAATLAVIQGLLGGAPRLAWQGLVRRACGDPGAEAEQVDAGELIERVLGAVRRVSARFSGSTCLGRALTAWVMLKRRRVSAVVRLGVAGSPERAFGAHAWLECGGRAVLGEPEAGQYVAFRGIGPA
jgi:hypothetical protein